MKSAVKYISAFGVAFIISGLAAYYAIGLFTKSAEEIILPELRGKNIIYVLETLTNMGLNAKLYGTRYDNTLPRYAVITQDPLPGTTIKRGRDVIIHISKGRKENVVPDLRQMPVKQALITLEKNEFTPGTISYTYSSKTKKDSIISQYPEPFSTAFKQSECSLLVSRGEPVATLIMPKLDGLQLETGSMMLKDQNLKISAIISEKDSTKPQGVILAHTPGAGHAVNRSTPVTLVVNHDQKNMRMVPERVSGIVYILHRLEPGFLNRHVRVETDILGPILDIFNDYMKPGEQVQLMLPAHSKALVNIYVDQELVKIITIDPWKTDHVTGDNLWESSLLPSYLQTSPDWVMN